MNSSTIYEEVQKRYSSCAQEESGDYATSVAKAFGYSEEELKSIPNDANLGLSCGNPTALANLREVSRFLTHTHYALIANRS
jgi:arsenite methyltransferase